MSGSGTVVLRRTWPQRIIILATIGVIGAAFAAAWFIDDVYESVNDIGRVEVSGEILLTDTEPGDPVNFLLIGEDSALGLDPDDPVLVGRDFDEQGRFFADTITILRVNPASSQAWVLSIPRDLLVEYRGERNINEVYLVDGPEGLVQAVTDNFDIPINHFIALDFVGFRQVVDELDGVPVWFANPARDLGPKGESSGLNIADAGCHVLDGEESLQYVRARNYQELIDGEWETIGNSDFGRIERQQDFLVLALDRAISRGARNPVTLSALIEAGANSLVLDLELTVAELIELGEAFSDFNAENLQRLSVDVDTIGSGADYEGERLVGDRNQEVFSVFRGETDLVSAADVSFDLYGADEAAVEQARIEFESLDFTVDGLGVLDDREAGNVVVHPPGRRAEAETIAQYLLPIPRIVEDPDAAAVSLVLGTDHEQILFFLPHPPAKVQAEVRALGDGPIPALVEATPVAGIELETVTTTTTEIADSSTTSTTTTTTLAPTTTAAAAPTTTAGIIGQAPEGQSCG
ncbi:MAG: LCP family protein [Actinomycetota bacterium]